MLFLGQCGLLLGNREGELLFFSKAQAGDTPLLLQAEVWRWIGEVVANGGGGGGGSQEHHYWCRRELQDDHGDYAEYVS